MKIADCRIDDEHRQVKADEKLSSVRNMYCHILVVVEGRKPVGIVTNNDLVRSIKSEADYERLKFRDIMTSPVVTVSLEDDLEKAADLMFKKGFMSLPVVDNKGDFVGLVTYFDYLGKIADRIKEKAKKSK
ncbi:hypothetical protein A3K63_00755 [Candidatus Micrarchaeota archaeon RBG_16_49_10]|nr:MAG: hypothetical protein A3K63_00755 [Candidatus Micrarchaeota archaeon RBG_16_49_10]